LMFKRLLLATSAVVLLAFPNVSFAQPNGGTAGPDKKNERPADQGRGSQAVPQRQAAPQAQARPQRQAAPQAQARPQNQQAISKGRQTVPNQSIRSASHVQQATQWRSTNPNWNSRTVWQRDPNWWNGNAGFKNYNGVRLNFFFAPGYGYYSVSREYWGHRWHVGDYLSSFFLRYVVSDYRNYGLPSPPYGYSWIWVNTSVLLVDRNDGYILDEEDNVW
jgi:Ni/Co efflux regulator RcnB